MARYDYGVTFNGRRIVHPGAYDYIDASAMVVPTPGSANLPVIMGQSNSGTPGTIAWFSDPDAAANYLGGGELLTAVQLMFSPTPEGGGGASIVGVLPVNSLTQATAASGGLTLTSKIYGDVGNRVVCSLTDGTLPGTKKFSAQRWDTGANKMEVFDNLGAVMKISYTGPKAYAEMSVTATGGVATKFQTKVGDTQATAVVDVSVDLTTSQYTSLADLVKYLTTVSGYQVDYVSYWNTALPLSQLDAVASTNIKTTSYVFAQKADLAMQVTTYSKFVSLTATTDPLVNAPTVQLSGGVIGAVPASWAPFYSAIKKQFSNILVLLTGSQTIHAEGLAHVNQMEQRQQRQVMFVGGLVGETVDQVKQRAATLNSSRAVLCYPEIYHSLVGNGKIPMNPYFTAALIAGRICGVDPAQPVTFNYFNLTGLAADYLAGDPAIDDLISSGVCMLERVQEGGIRLVQGITTYQGPNNTLYREISVRRGADSLADTMRATMESKYVGKKGLRATISSVTTTAIDVLDKAIKEGSIIGYKDIQVRFINTAVYVDYKVAPVEPINYVLLTSHFVPGSSL